ncbi:hypothetical protein ABPG72_010853 [Tetrahymena utriculariae]
MIIDSSLVGNVIDEIALNENLNDDEQNDSLAKIFSENSHLRNHHDLLKPWESRDFKMLLQSYINIKYKKEKLQIPNDFAEKVYVKTYNQNIQTNNRFKLPLKVLYHPYVTRDDYNYVNDKLGRGQRLELYGSLGSIFITSTILFTTKWGKSIKDKPVQFYSFMGIPPIFMIIFAQVYSNYYINYKLQKIGIYSKYGLNFGIANTY